MEVVLALAGCLLTGCSAYLAASGAPAGPPRPARGRRIRREGLRDALVSWMELVGHWVPVVRLSNVRAVAGFSGRLRPALAALGVVLTRRGCTALLACWAVACMLACLVVSASPLGLPVGAAAAAAAALVLVGRHERSVQGAAAEQMPEVLRALSAALGSGRSLSQAIEYVGMNIGDPLGPEFLRASFEVKAGRPIEAAVSDLCGRVGAPGMALLGTALQISQRTGSSLNDLFARTAQMVSDTVGLRRELVVKTSQVRLSAKIVACMPAVLAGVLVLLSADYREGIGMPAGRACLCVAALLDATALFAVQRLMRRSLA